MSSDLILPPSASIDNAEVELAGGAYSAVNGATLATEDVPSQEFYFWFIPIGVRGTLALVVAPPGLGKSRFCLQMAASQVAGLPFCGLHMNPTPRRTLVIQNENCRQRLHKDLSFCRDLPADKLCLLRERLFVTGLERDADGDISIDERDPEGGNFCRLKELVQRTNPEVVIVDTWPSMCPEELDAKAIRTTVMTLRRICAASANGPVTLVLVTHSKPGLAAAAAARGTESLSYARGSRVLVGMARVVLNLRACEIVGDQPVELKPVGNGKVTLSTGIVKGIELCPAKTNDGRLPEPIAIRLNEERFAYERVDGFNHAAWQETLEKMARANASQSPAAKAAEAAAALTSTQDRVANLLEAQGPMGKVALVGKLIEIGVATSKRNAAETLRWLCENGQLKMVQPKPNRPARYYTPKQFADAGL